MQNKYLMIFKKRKYALLIILIVIIAITYIFYPRSVYSLIVAKDSSVENITLVTFPTTSNEHKEIFLSEENRKTLLDILDSNYARIKLFRKKSTSSDFMGYFIFVEYKEIGNNDVVYFFTTDIISVNGVQYNIYGKKLSEGVTNIFESENK